MRNLTTTPWVRRHLSTTERAAIVARIPAGVTLSLTNPRGPEGPCRAGLVGSHAGQRMNLSADWESALSPYDAADRVLTRYGL